jgi:hypothetical protein
MEENSLERQWRWQLLLLLMWLQISGAKAQIICHFVKWHYVYSLQLMTSTTPFSDLVNGLKRYSFMWFSNDKELAERFSKYIDAFDTSECVVILQFGLLELYTSFDRIGPNETRVHSRHGELTIISVHNHTTTEDVRRCELIKPLE